MPFKESNLIDHLVFVGLVYQTADATVIYGVAILAYIVAIGKGEIVGDKATDDSTV
jgi:hypothetical protein